MSPPGLYSKLRRSPHTISLVGAFIVLLTLLPAWWFTSQWYEGRLLNEQRSEAAVQTALRANALSLAVGRRLARLQGLHAFVQTADFPSSGEHWVEFDSFAAELYTHSHGIRSMTVALDGVVRFVYPLTGNEDLIGHQPLQDTQPEINAAAHRALVTGMITLVGPITPAEGQSALTITQAVYRKETDQSLVSIVVDLFPLLDEAELDLPEAGLAFALRDGVGRVFVGSPELLEQNPIVAMVELPEGVWELAGAPVEGWEAAVLQPLRVVRVTGLVIIGLLATLAYLTINRQTHLALAVRQRTEELALINEMLEQRVEQRSRQLSEQAGLLAVIEERQRIARELHDSVSQALYGIGLGARTALKLLKKEPSMAAESLDYVLSLAAAGLAEMRALIFELRPDSLEKEGLISALSKQATSLEARHQVPVRTKLGPEPPIPLVAKEALYRIAQEALNNVVKHARAGRISLSLQVSSADLVLRIEDDGVGFDPTGGFPGHLGLKTMQERAAQVGGKCEISSSPGVGTVVQVSVPHTQ
jgi:signal transduction histidine kinase